MSEEKVKVLITLEFEEELIAQLQERYPTLAITSHPVQKGETLPEELWEQAEVLYTHRVLPEDEQAPNLRWIQFHLAGVDRQIEHPILSREKLQSTTLSGANAPQAAEHALALMLALGHNLTAMFSDQSRNKWSARRAQRYQPQELFGGTVGIVGYGSVGRTLARLLKPFGVTVLASKRDLLHPEENGYRIEQPEDEDGDYVRRLYPGRAMRSMFKDCDFVVICAPLTRETKGMISTKQLSALKPSAFLIDVSRGGILDHEALIEALDKEQLAGAALDVFPEEPLPADSPLWGNPHVIISPHVAGFSPRYNERAMALFIENMGRYLAGEDLLNKVDLKRGY